MAQQQPQQAIHKFVLGNKELEGKTAEFQYDKGWYSITDIVGEERNVIYKSRNAREAAESTPAFSLKFLEIVLNSSSSVTFSPSPLIMES